MKIKDIIFLDVKTIYEAEGNLSVLENYTDFLFKIKRFYYIYNTPENVLRGNHAHKKTKQLFICLNGSCEITCDDGEMKKTFLLDNPNKALNVPEGIWSSEIYADKTTILLVLCNTNYKESDYIKNYDKFIKYKQK